MMMMQLKRCPHFQVTLETSLRRLPRIDDRVRRATTLDVQTARAMARLAAHVLSVLSLRLQSRVRRCFEVAYNLFVTGFAFFRADELRARYARRSENCAICRAAGKQNDSDSDSASGTPAQAFAFTVNPSSYPRVPHESRVCAELKNVGYAFSQVFSYSEVRILPKPANHMFRIAELRWRCPAQSFEDAIKLRKGLKSRGERNLTDPKIAVTQKSARLFESGTCDVLDKAQAGHVLESFAKIIRVFIESFRHSPKRKFSARMFLDKLARFPDLSGFSPVSEAGVFKFACRQHFYHLLSWN
jgi:hypothetical protein